MHKRSSKKPAQDQATVNPTTGLSPDGKNLAAVALGRLGGLKGGKARAAKLSAKQRSDIAKKAARSRWSKKQI